MSQNDKSEFLELMMLWRNEGLAPLASVIGFSQALLEEKAGEINEEQRQLLELIFRAGVRAADCWHSAADYANLHDGTSQEACRAFELGEVIDRALSHLEKKGSSGFHGVQKNLQRINVNLHKLQKISEN